VHAIEVKEESSLAEPLISKKPDIDFNTTPDEEQSQTQPNLIN